MPDLPPIVSRRRDRLPATTVVPPEIQERPCATCAAAVLAAPSSQKAVDAGVCRMLCETCAFAELLAGKPFVAAMLPAAREELRRYSRMGSQTN